MSCLVSCIKYLFVVAWLTYISTGYVGAGMLSAAVAGSVFTSPPPQDILAGLRIIAKDNPGILCCTNNNILNMSDLEIFVVWNIGKEQYLLFPQYVLRDLAGLGGKVQYLKLGGLAEFFLESTGPFWKQLQTTN